MAVLGPRTDVRRLPGLLGPPCPQRDLAPALIISRVAARLQAGHADLAADVTLGADLGVAGGSTGDIYAAMEWLASRQDPIEAKLAARHLAGVDDVHFKLAV